MALEEAGIDTHSSPVPPRLLGNVEETQGKSRPWKHIGKGWEQEKFTPILLISAGINTSFGVRQPVRSSLTLSTHKTPRRNFTLLILPGWKEQSRGSPASGEISTPGLSRKLGPSLIGTGSKFRAGGGTSGWPCPCRVTLSLRGAFPWWLSPNCPLAPSPPLPSPAADYLQIFKLMQIRP